MPTSNAPSTPTGEGAPAAGAHRALKQDEAKQELFEAVLASDNLVRAWKRVKSNEGAPGIDGVTVEDWPGSSSFSVERDSLISTRPARRGGRANA